MSKSGLRFGAWSARWSVVVIGLAACGGTQPVSRAAPTDSPARDLVVAWTRGEALPTDSERGVAFVTWYENAGYPYEGHPETDEDGIVRITRAVCDIDAEISRDSIDAELLECSRLECTYPSPDEGGGLTFRFIEGDDGESVLDVVLHLDDGDMVEAAQQAWVRRQLDALSERTCTPAAE